MKNIFLSLAVVAFTQGCNGFGRQVTMNGPAIAQTAASTQLNKVDRGNVASPKKSHNPCTATQIKNKTCTDAAASDPTATDAAHADTSKTDPTAATANPAAVDPNATDPGTDTDLEKQILHDKDFRTRLVDLEKAQAVDCMPPRYGQLREECTPANGTTASSCSFLLDITCVTLITQNSSNDQLLRATFSGTFDKTKKTYVYSADDPVLARFAMTKEDAAAVAPTTTSGAAANNANATIATNAANPTAAANANSTANASAAANTNSNAANTNNNANATSVPSTVQK